MLATLKQSESNAANFELFTVGFLPRDTISLGRQRLAAWLALINIVPGFCAPA